MRTAFKEWAVIVDALGRGEQILVLRKGGIHEPGREFAPEHGRFWLFPTLFHQQAESVVPDARARFEHDLAAGLDEQLVSIRFLAETTSAARLESHSAIRHLRGHHIWKEDVIEQRFDWGARSGVYALILRVHALPAPVNLPREKSYGGCRSWIELARDVPELDLRPVLDDADFNYRERTLRDALGMPTPAT